MKNLLFFIVLSLGATFYGQSAKDYDKAESRDYNMSVADLDKIIDLNPNYSKVYNNRGYAKDELKDYLGNWSQL